MKMQKLRSKLKSILPALVLVLCIIQPLLDVISYWQDKWGLSNAPTTVLRFAMLAAVVLVGFILSERRRYYYILAAVLAALTAAHVVACSQWGYGAPAADLANTLRIYQLPLMTVSFISMVRADERCVESIKKGFLICLLICAGVEVVSVLTKTNAYTYRDQKSVGICGWFYFANSQSAILTMLVPVSLSFVLERKNKLPVFAAVSLVGFGVLYFFATRLAFAALIGIGLGLPVCLVVLWKKDGMQIGRPVAVLLLCTIVCVLAVGISPLERNNQLVARNLERKQQDIDAMVAADEAEAVEAGLEAAQLQTARLSSAYEEYLAGPTGRFGLERTAEFYHYSTDASDIADVRRERLTFCKMLLEEQPGLSFWFGMEREDMSHDNITYDVENDFHGIFYLCGAVGLALMIAFLGWFVLRIVFALFKDFKHVFTLQAAGCGLALICCLAHAYLTAGVLRRPNVTFYLAALLAVAYALTMKKRSQHET